jgi:glycosyltransferase involved in cell wall biosynthesis
LREVDVNTLENLLSIDVVICTYNNADLLDRALEALEKQDVSSGVEWNVLVVDNNCTDGTPDVVQRYVKRGKIASLTRVLEPQQGLTFARLCGVESTHGEWIAFVDDDCLLRENWVAEAAEFARNHPACGAFGGRVTPRWEVPPPDFVLKYQYAYAVQDYGPMAIELSYLVGAGLVVRRSALCDSGWTCRQFLDDRVGNQLISGGDMEIGMRIRSAGYELWYTPTCQLMHVIPASRTTEWYLIDINYGLGSSQQHVDSIRWEGSHLSWLLTSTFNAFRASLVVWFRSVMAALGRRPRVEVAIDASFARGRWSGFWNMLRMEARERRALVGCAKVAR